MLTISQAFTEALEHQKAGRLGAAEALYRQILAVQPDHADALHFYGVLAHQVGRHAFAVELIQRAIALCPDNPGAHANLGEVYRVAGRNEEAVGSLRRALQLDDQQPDAWNSLGLALAAQGGLGEAEAAYRRALQLRPSYPEALSNLGSLLRQRVRIEEAMAVLGRALQIDPRYAAAHNNLASALRDQGRFDEALAVYRNAVQLQPHSAEIRSNLACTLADVGRLDEAIDELCRAIPLQPQLPEIHNNLGNVRKDRGEIDEAIAAYRRAVELKPNYAEAWNNLGNALIESGELDAAVAAYRRALEIRPDHAAAHSNLICALHYHPGCDAREVRAELRRWDVRHGHPAGRFAVPYRNRRDMGRRLRIGYVSPEFRHHVIGHNIMPLLRNHDREQFEVLCYSGVTKPDDLTEEIRRSVGVWRNILGLGDAALAALVQEDEVDILVDLALHTSGNRLPAFALQPAPVQVSFAGYPAGTGLEAIRHRISDRYLEGDLPADEVGSGETLFLLDSYWCYDPCGLHVNVNPLPAQASGWVTFACLNQFGKVNAPLLRMWARVLVAVAYSRLILLSHEGQHRQRVMGILADAGVAPERVEFVAPRGHVGYLELYHRVDIALDPFPYNGHTTSLDGLWMGVPVVSLIGPQSVSRAGLGQLSNLGLPEWVATSEDDYVELAGRLAGDISRLAELRRTLRGRMEGSVLMDARRFTRGIEAAYRAMWRQWCANSASLSQ